MLLMDMMASLLDHRRGNHDTLWRLKEITVLRYECMERQAISRRLASRCFHDFGDSSSTSHLSLSTRRTSNGPYVRIPT